MSNHELNLGFQLMAEGTATPEREYRFAAHQVGMGPGIKLRLAESGLKDWRFDFAWPDQKFACEVEGGGGMGRHTTAKGFRQDIVKYHHAMALGWTVYRCDGALVKSGAASQLIAMLLKPTDREIGD